MPAGWRLEAHRPPRREPADAATQIGVVFHAPGGEQLRSLSDIKAYLDRERPAYGAAMPTGVSARNLAELGKRARQVGVCAAALDSR